MSYTAPSITASGTTFAQLQSRGWTGLIDALIAAQAATADPTAAPTGAASGTGNTLAAGTYYLVFTETNGIGETKISPQSTQQTVTSGQKLTVTFPTLKTGNVARRLYAGAVNGPSGGPYALYASGITTTTYDMTVAAPSNSYAGAPPTVNSTGLIYTGVSGNPQNKPMELLRYARKGDLQKVHDYAQDEITNFLKGDPIPFAALLTRLRHFQTVFALINQACTEAGTLIDANAGTLGNTIDPNGQARTVRTWP